MKLSYSTLIIFCLFFELNAVLAQEKLIVKGEVWSNQLEKTDSAKITVLDIDGKQINEVYTKKGLYKVTLGTNTEYTLVIEKKPMVTKRVKFDTRVYKCNEKIKTWIYKFNKLSLFDAVPGEDYSVYEGVMATIGCDSTSCIFGVIEFIPDPIVQPELKDKLFKEEEPEVDLAIRISPPLPAPKQKKQLNFMVQIGAYAIPDNYKTSKYKSLGAIEKRELGDGITRFTVGYFSDAPSAIALRQKALDLGISDAFIVIIEDGVRKYIDDFPELFDK